jgi:endo-1,4-beta-xylanase
MVSFTSLLAFCTAVIAVVGAPEPMALARYTDEEARDLERRQTVTTSQTGTSGGYYYSCWIQSNSGVTMNIGTGSYSLSWSTASQDVVAGIGWNPGAAR